jgi:hypothetical protein
MQYRNSLHYLGGQYLRRTSTTCSACHTSQGFLDRIATGSMVASAEIIDPAPQNCRTCHQIHKTYTGADYALTSTAPVALWATPGVTVDIGAQSGNLCVQCHQGRPTTLPELGSEPFAFNRNNFHHSPVGQVLGGVGAFEFSGSASIAGGSFTHGDPEYNPGSCATCHMATATGRGLDMQSGGHTWKMSYEYNGSEYDNVTGCNSTGCHKTVEDFEHWGVQEEVADLMADLSAELFRLGIKTSADPESVSSRAGTFPADVAAAMMNFQMFQEDKSHGIHNPPYVRNVLKNSIQKMKTY